MATFLLNWKPGRWPWDELEDDLRDFRRDSYLDTSWSCGVTKDIVEGDRVFLIRLGEEPRGIVASGTVQRHDLFEDIPAARAMSDVYEAPHWEDPERTALYVNVRFDGMLNPEVRVFPIDRLNELNDGLSHSVKKQVWASQSSGIRIREDIADRLEVEWREFLASGETGGERAEDLDEQGRNYSRLLKRRGGVGEGEPHRQLKSYVASNPQAIGLPAGLLGREEHLFISGDECDVAFDLNEGESVVVEVKDGKERGELVKGIYQAVKYRALMAAEKGRGEEYPVRAYLVAYSVPADVARYAARFGIECKALDRSLVQSQA